MLTVSLFTAAARRAERRRAAPLCTSLCTLGAALAFALLTGPAAAGTPEAPLPGEITVQAAPGTSQAFQQAIVTLTDALLAKAAAAAPGGGALVIDPLIDRDSGAETAGTRTIAAVIEDRVRDHDPQIQMRPFTPESLADKPFVIMGSIAPAWKVRSSDLPIGKPQVYYLWAVVADLRTDRILGLEHAWVRAADASPTPTAFFRDSPVWSSDAMRAAYLKMCSSPAGTVLDVAYKNALSTQAVIASAVRAYDAHDFSRALDLYTHASKMRGGEQLRVLNGIYLSDVALGRAHDAETAFARLVEYGLDRDRLAVKFLFRVASTGFWPDPAVSRPYPMWVRQIGDRTAAHATCLQITGHASPTGIAALNDRLSLARARRMEVLLTAAAPGLAGHTAARGVGSRDPIIGTGTDDATDALDRRVDFMPMPCGHDSAAKDRPAPQSTPAS